MTEEQQPVDEHQSAPEEPFSFMANNPGWGIRSPAFLAVFFAAFTAFSLWIMYSGLTGFAESGEASALVLATIAISGVALGVGFTYVGIRRWRWKREYERVMGRSPW